MDRQRPNTLGRLGAVAFLALTACAQKYEPNPPQTLLGTPTGMVSPLETSGSTPTPTPTSLVDSAQGSLLNPLTNTRYETLTCPNGKRGVKLGKYTSSQKYTVFGGATVLGPDPSRYNDYPKFVVYDTAWRVLGEFSTDAMPDPDTLSIVLPGTIVCEK